MMQKMWSAGTIFFAAAMTWRRRGAASDLVEDFGALAFKAGAFACGHDGDGEVCGVHTGIWSHVRGL